MEEHLHIKKKPITIMNKHGFIKKKNCIEIQDEMQEKQK
jgi:hypothetical protein